eukprot:360737-Amphidinium_carterae.1
MLGKHVALEMHRGLLRACYALRLRERGYAWHLILSAFAKCLVKQRNCFTHVPQSAILYFLEEYISAGSMSHCVPQFAAIAAPTLQRTQKCRYLVVPWSESLYAAILF